MKEEVLEMYRDGATYDEIEEATDLAPGTIRAYVYDSKINKDMSIMQVRMYRKIKDLIAEYEEVYNQKFSSK